MISITTTASVLSLVLFITTYAEWIAPDSPLLPKQDMCQAIGYHNGEVTILSENSNGLHDIVKYDISEKEFGIPVSGFAISASSSVYEYGQFWTQIDNMVYMIDDTGNAVNKYDLSTMAFGKWVDIPISVGYTGCLASTQDTLYVVGGEGNLQNLQIFDISTKTWSVGPEMNIGRQSFSCIVSAANNVLYAIGGETADGITDTVEYISLDEVKGNEWKFVAGKLDKGLYGTRAVSYGPYVGIIGGADKKDKEVDLVHYIDTTKQYVFEHPEKMVYGLSFGAPIIVGHMIFVFGGQTKYGVTQGWQYYDLSTLARDGMVDGEGASNSNGDGVKDDYALRLGIGAAVLLLAAVLIGVVVWKYVGSTKGFKRFGVKLNNEYGSVVATEMTETNKV